MVVKNEAGEPVMNPATARPRYSVIVLQRLLLKGRRHDSERNTFNVSAAAPLLQEISEALRARHGGAIPCVPPRRSLDSGIVHPQLLRVAARVISGQRTSKLR